MLPRPHPIILIALAVACFLIAFLIAPRRALPSEGVGSQRAVPSAAHALAAHALAAPRARPSHVLAAPRAAWRWPLRGRVVGAFRVTPGAPFARGQRRGIDVAAAPGTTVRAACAGRVSFAGSLPHQGLAVTVRCGELVATYLRLGRLGVRRGDHAALGRRLGTLGAAGSLRLGARRAGRRRGYVDPLALLRDPRPAAPPALGPAPAPRHPRAAPPRPRTAPAASLRAAPAPSPRPRPNPALMPGAPRRLPWPAYPAVALIATALPVGGLIRRRRRHAATANAAAADAR